MPKWLPPDEYRRIRSSWRGAGPQERWNNSQMVDACHANLREAAQREARLRQLDQEWPIGDARRLGDLETPSLQEQIRTAVRDQAHWREYVGYWRNECVGKGPDAYPPDTWTRRSRIPWSPPAMQAKRMNCPTCFGLPDPCAKCRGEREPGEDDAA